MQGSTQAGEEKTYLTIATPSCVADDFVGEIVALNLDTGFYFSLRGLAGAVWRDLASGHPRERILEALAVIDNETAAKASTFIDQLIDRGLMRASTGSDVTHELESGALAASGSTEIVLESFDDMKDLVIADPIHEVEEDAGWPVRRGN